MQRQTRTGDLWESGSAPRKELTECGWNPRAVRASNSPGASFELTWVIKFIKRKQQGSRGGIERRNPNSEGRCCYLNGMQHDDIRYARQSPPLRRREELSHAPKYVSSTGENL